MLLLNNSVDFNYRFFHPKGNIDSWPGSRKDKFWLRNFATISRAKYMIDKRETSGKE